MSDQENVIEFTLDILKQLVDEESFAQYQSPQMAIVIVQYYQVAQIAHEVNKVYCESIGDNSQKSWKDAPYWQKVSAIKGMYHLTKNIDRIVNGEYDVSETHNSWLREKKKEGWAYGKVKNEELRLHPCVVPYKDLPKEQQTKDHLFLGVFKGFMNI